jgi:hypothetical protein
MVAQLRCPVEMDLLALIAGISSAFIAQAASSATLIAWECCELPVGAQSRQAFHTELSLLFDGHGRMCIRRVCLLHYRDKVLSTGPEDLHSLAPVLEVVADLGQVAAVTSAGQAAAVGQQRPAFFDKTYQVL